MSNGYLDLFKVGTLDCLTLGNIDETTAVISYLKGQSQHVIPSTVHNPTDTLMGVLAGMSPPYSSGYFLTCINTYMEKNALMTDVDSPPRNMSSYEVPYNFNDSYTFVITDKPFSELKANSALVDTSFVKAFGVKFESAAPPPPLPPPEPPGPNDEVWSGGRTFVTIRDNDTLAELGVSYDLMNTKIYEEINGKYTLDFNILPYFNVYRIRHPNFLEINNDYFRIRRVEKKRNDTLIMAISCEHISYELNNQYELDIEDEDIVLPDYPYGGTPTDILTEMLEGSRFTIGTVHFDDYVEFVSKPMGTRSMIIALAKQIGAEVKFDKFTISLLARRGAPRNLSFEVGKNLISMTEVYDTHANGAFNRSYNVDVIDLSLIDNGNDQEELYNIRLGDTVTLIDEQFSIDIQQRIVSYQIDPFRKELPVIEIEHVTKNIVNSINNIDKKAKVNVFQSQITRTKESNAFGYKTTATGQYSHAEGKYTEAFGSYSHAEGNSSTASGPFSHAEGNVTKALDVACHSEGSGTTALGRYSHAEGFETHAIGESSHASGSYTHATQDFSTAIGSHNKWLEPGDTFVIGVGYYDFDINTAIKVNGLRVTTDGATYGQSAFNSAGADYAEYFEWEDGNPNNEDRKGYFVTLDGDKVRKATSIDDYVLGIVSVNPSVVGDSYQDQWSNMYVTNEWGETQKETVHVPALLNAEGKELTPEREETRPVLNPNYDSSAEYTSREKRPEWSPIGMMGKLLVRDDGTSSVNGYCKPNDNGVATSSVEGYRVMERISETIIRVLIK